MVFELQQYLYGLKESVALFSEQFRDADHEVLWIAHVSSDLRFLKLVDYHGDQSCVIAPVREIITDVLESKSDAIVLAHNHLSGDPRPSPDDILFTSKLCSISKEMDFTVLDHIIFAGRQWSSMRQLGLM